MNTDPPSCPAPALGAADVESGWVFNVQKYSVHDGPGIRTTVFFKGCPLSCAWCHNPESQSPQPEILIAEGRCLVCGQCRAACPFGETLPGGAVLPARNAPCTRCDACIEACPTGARQRVGQRRTAADVLAEVEADRVFYEESAGGVTFSGGEPLSQPAFLKALLAGCRARGLHTAVDTCGFGRAADLLACAQLADLVLYDLKFMDSARHRQHCGVPNEPILENLHALAALHRRLWIRVPVIPGINDDAENLSALARFVAVLAGVEQVNLLAYHATGQAKHQRLGRSYALDGVAAPSDKHMAQAAQWFRAAGLNVHVGG